MFKVTVVEVLEEREILRLEQTVDVIDLAKVFAAINAKPRKPRVRKEKA